MTNTLKFATAVIGLVVAVLELSHLVTGSGPSVVRTVTHVVVEAPHVEWPDFDSTDIPDSVEDFDRDFEERVDELFPDRDRSRPTFPPSDWPESPFDDDVSRP
ncbi:MAG: hypothetical protein AAGA65_26965 [Actinomycetota bacterium]